MPSFWLTLHVYFHSSLAPVLLLSDPWLVGFRSKRLSENTKFNAWYVSPNKVEQKSGPRCLFTDSGNMIFTNCSLRSCSAVCWSLPHYDEAWLPLLCTILGLWHALAEGHRKTTSSQLASIHGRLNAVVITVRSRLLHIAVQNTNGEEDRSCDEVHRILRASDHSAQLIQILTHDCSFRVHLFTSRIGG